MRLLFALRRIFPLHRLRQRASLAAVMRTRTSPAICGALGAAAFTVLVGLAAVPFSAQTRVYKEAHVYVTAPPSGTAAAQLLSDSGFHPFEPLDQPDENFPTIIIDETKTFQTIEGFGGAFTDAASTTFGKLPRESQEEFLKASFDPVEGNGYTLCRTTIHSCDYSGEMYTYDDTPGDKDL
jgi:hypothetical protein